MAENGDFVTPDEFRNPTALPYEGYEQQDALIDESQNLGGQLGTPQQDFRESYPDLSAYAEGTPMGNFQPGGRDYPDLSGYGTKPEPGFWSKINKPAVEGNYMSSPLMQALGGIAPLLPYANKVVPAVQQKQAELAKQKMAAADRKLKLTNNAIALSKQDLKDPLMERAFRGTMDAAGVTDTGLVDSLIKAKTDQRTSYMGLMFKAMKGGMTLEELQAGTSGLDPDLTEKLLEFATKTEDKQEKRAQNKELMQVLIPQAPLVQAPVPETPVQEGPGSTTNQDLTVNPRTRQAILATEASGDTAVSPKGAASKYQVMPETARPYLIEMGHPAAKGSTEDIKAIMSSDPKVAEQVALSHMARLEKKFNGNPKAVAAAWISGEGNVNPDGSLKNPDVHDGNMTAQQYVDRFSKRFEGQNLVSGKAPNVEGTGRLAAINSQIAAKEARIQEVQRTLVRAVAYGNTPAATAMNSMITKLQADKTSLESDRRQLEDRLTTVSEGAARRQNTVDVMREGHKLSRDQALELQEKREAEARAVRNIEPEDILAYDRGLQQRNDEEMVKAKAEGREPKLQDMPDFTNKGDLLTWAKETKVKPLFDIAKAGEKVDEKLGNNIRILDTMQEIFALAPSADTGPVSGRILELKNRFNVQGDNNHAVFGALVNKVFNQDLREFAGAGMTRPEIANKRMEIFSVRDRPEIFRVKSQEFYDALLRDHGKYVGSLEKRKFYVSPERKLPTYNEKSQTPGPPEPTEKPATGAGSDLARRMITGEPKENTPTADSGSALAKRMRGK